MFCFVFCFIHTVCSGDRKCVGLARVGHETQIIKYGTMKQLLTFDFGDPLHCLVIPSKTHEIEDEMLELFEITGNTNENANESKTNTGDNESDNNDKKSSNKKRIPLVFQYANEVQNRLREQYINKQLNAQETTGTRKDT